MMKFYTAVAQYRLLRDEKGRPYPAVIKERQEFCLSIEEMILWASSLWRIHTYDELEKLFYQKESEDSAIIYLSQMSLHKHRGEFDLVQK